MSNATIARLQDEVRSNTEFIEKTLSEIEEGEEQRDLSKTEMESVERAKERIAELVPQIERLQDFEATRASAVELDKVVAAPAAEKRQHARTEVRSLAAQITESEQFRAYAGRGTSDPISIDTRAVGPDPLLTTTTPGSVLLPKAEQFMGITHRRPFPLLDLVGKMTTGSSAVEMITTSDATGHDEVAEGAQKPPIVWTANSQTFSLKNYAGWFKFSRQALSDIPMLQSLIASKLQQSLETKLNGEAVVGLNAAITGANTTTGAAKVTLLELIRGAIGTLSARGVAPGAVLLNPADHAALDISMITQTLNGAQVYGSFFGLPVVSVQDVTAGTAIVGDIGQAVTWVSKDGAQSYLTDSDISGEGATAKSDFRANLLTALLEVRGVMVPTDAPSIQKVIVTP